MICMAPPFPSSSRMDAWPQRRGLQAVSMIRKLYSNMSRYEQNTGTAAAVVIILIMHELMHLLN